MEVQWGVITSKDCSVLFSQGIVLYVVTAMYGTKWFIIGLVFFGKLAPQVIVLCGSCKWLFCVATARDCSVWQLQEIVLCGNCNILFCVATARDCSVWQLQEIVLCGSCNILFCVATARDCSVWQLQEIVLCVNCNILFCVATTRDCYVWQLQEIVLCENCKEWHGVVLYGNIRLFSVIQRQGIVLCGNQTTRDYSGWYSNF
jgi:hypothetical protein